MSEGTFGSAVGLRGIPAALLPGFFWILSVVLGSVAFSDRILGGGVWSGDLAPTLGLAGIALGGALLGGLVLLLPQYLLYRSRERASLPFHRHLPTVLLDRRAEGRDAHFAALLAVYAAASLLLATLSLPAGIAAFAVSALLTAVSHRLGR